ncbi:MAG: ATP-dependent DNA helicase RecG [Clostridiales bacterium]|nr:ATP-dependent DNA helicase RecG [Clostridiales bacterium]
MSQNIDLLELLDKEARSGYYDSSVFGGLSGFLKNWGGSHSSPKISQLANEYAKASLSKRPALLQELRLLLEAVEAGERQLDQVRQVVQPEQNLLSASVRNIPKIGSKTAALFRRLGACSIEELLFFFPRDYQDRRQITPIAQLLPGQSTSIIGRVQSVQLSAPRARLTILQAKIQDNSGGITAIWFNQGYLENSLKQGRKVHIYGKMDNKYNHRQFQVQDFSFPDQENTPLGLHPIYRSTENLSQKTIRQAVIHSLEKYGPNIPEILPEDIITRRNLQGRVQAVHDMHLPADWQVQEQARRRLAYEELLILQLALQGNSDNLKGTGIAHPPAPELLMKFKSALPFPLTVAQDRVISEIFADMEKPVVMQRLVQGDVGSGKTLVAAAALSKAVTGGFQAALMAPTEILANQHYQTLQPLLLAFGIRTELFTAALGGKTRQELLLRCQNGEVDVLIGTHTLIQQGVEFARLGLAVTDEQHRFGVLQRARLQEKGRTCDMLIMTATPIPRTLALTLYGDLQISVIDQMPPGRQPVLTYAVDYSYEKRLWAFVDKHLEQGRQVFVVCPLVEESAKIDLENALGLAERLQKQILPKRQTAVLHGKMKSEEKDRIMTSFAQGEIQILVATTVIEVGINIPNATVMMVRDAERFGLAQLHQLRGRIGRGSDQSYCLLLHNAKGDIAKERMKIMSETADGFAIAEADLRLRGPGEFWGTRQHGLPELRCANLFRDSDLIEQARSDALELRCQKNWENIEIKELKSVLTEKIKLMSN